MQIIFVTQCYKMDNILGVLGLAYWEDFSFSVQLKKQQNINGFEFCILHKPNQTPVRRLTFSTKPSIASDCCRESVMSMPLDKSEPRGTWIISAKQVCLGETKLVEGYKPLLWLNTGTPYFCEFR